MHGENNVNIINLELQFKILLTSVGIDIILEYVLYIYIYTGWK
jgi:hypothetical protein